ncbi:hypothetical protein CHLNCDRAFT_145328 [Chlorella variabilis]|uniref:Uncharacterized protein n=1 Tax=Chlorella variabilis TaxID=554065 RepID=E1ZE68_CHLVA|nr:hypothetical protein CHLNCDRAFT_145328 [Chlorella variabilis]EFN55817.1 hypothetical protein CHLNCDRAFT_145328 [Chlorella variabilis]|eukprot:XP_005847919.1 hypothetical protein CHLNCDRAFT_145328 [Chlorella variabilis]
MQDNQMVVILTDAGDPAEVEEAVELPLPHPELYEDIGIKPPKVAAGAGVGQGTG